MKKLLALLAVCSSLWSQTLYILFEVGETSALIDVMKKAEENHDDYVIFAQGVAISLLKAHPEISSKILPIELEENIDRNWKRDALLSQKSVDAILEQVKADKVVSGVHFHFYGQLLKAYEERGAQTYAYWDNINTDGSDPYFQSAKMVADSAKTLLAPSYSFLKKYPNALIVGQPALEMIPNPFPKPDVDIPLNHPVVVWIGGYGEEYNEALTQFLSQADALKDAMIILCYHPKYEGVVEKEMMAKYPHSNVFIYDAKKLSSFQAIALADIVVCHQSTAGLQAAIGGKKVVYFTPKGQSYTNLLIESKIAPQISSLSELKTESEPSKDILDVLQVPRNATERLYQLLHTT